MSPQGLVVQPVGFAFARIAADEAEILTIGVSALHQSSGIGAALLRELAKSVRTHGAHRLFLEVAKNNAPALKLYARAGFEKVGTRRGYYQSTNGTAMDAIIMARRLTGLADNELMHPKASMDAQR
ncbi:MAG: ribosomal protein S18-alanine N-acetyltransferase [Pseudomonadota bacterium]